MFDFLRAFFRFGAYLAHSSGGSILRFGMVFILPGSVRRAQRIVLLTTLDLVASNLGEEGAAPPLTDVGDNVDRQDNVCSSG